MNTVIKAKEVSSLLFICPQCKKTKEIDYFNDLQELKVLREKKYSENHSCCGTKYSVEY